MYVCVVCEHSGQAFKTVCASCWSEMQKRSFAGSMMLAKLNTILSDDGDEPLDMGDVEREVYKLKALEQGLQEGLEGDELWTAILE